MSSSPKLLASQGALFNGSAMQSFTELDVLVRRAVQLAFRQGSKSRQAIAEDMARLLGRPVTVRMLDNFTAESHPQHRFPAAWLPAFCIAAGDCEVLRHLVEAIGYRMVNQGEATLIDLARAYLEQKHATEKMEELEGRLKSRPRGE